MSVAETAITRAVVGRATRGEKTRELMFRVGLLGCLFVAILFLTVLIIDVLVSGAGRLNADFFTSYHSRINPDQAGIRASLLGTLFLMGLCSAFIVPVGVAAAVYLEEYADPARWYNRVIEVNIQNLASVPSVVYGILGLAFIVRGPVDIWGLGKGQPTLLAGALTLGLLVLPVVIIVAREAIRAVPPSIREGSLALGATKWQMIWKQVLPGAIAGIATGVILALSRAIGETAPLILVGASVFRLTDPTYDSAFSALPIQIYQYVGEVKPVYQDLAAAAIIALLALLLMMNSVAIVLRNRYEQKW